MTDERSTNAGLPERARQVGEGTPAVPRQWRMSAKTKQEAVLRVMREQNLLAHQRAGSSRGPRAHDSTITTSRVDDVFSPGVWWSTDL